MILKNILTLSVSPSVTCVIYLSYQLPVINQINHCYEMSLQDKWYDKFDQYMSKKTNLLNKVLSELDQRPHAAGTGEPNKLKLNKSEQNLLQKQSHLYDGRQIYYNLNKVQPKPEAKLTRQNLINQRNMHDYHIEYEKTAPKDVGKCYLKE